MPHPEVRCHRREHGPRWMRECAEPPRFLYVQGELPPDTAPAVAIVGSRNASGSGIWSAHRLAHDLAVAGVTVVSGLARGVDAAAHQGALDGGGRTVAFLGSGLERPSPLALEMREAILVRGALASEVGPDVEARPFLFVRRNRLIAAMALGTVVVEAGRSSGALITAGQAVAQGRLLWAVPGDPRRPGCRGNNGLLRDGVPAALDAKDVLAGLGLAGTAVPGDSEPPPGLDAPGEALWRALQREGAVHAERLARITLLPADQVLRTLSVLELQGHIHREAQGFALSQEGPTLGEV